MVCPKCGSETVDAKFIGEYCPNCRKTIKSLKEQHQQRLDKVLNKFEEEVGSNNIVFYYNKGLLRITYYAHTKYFTLNRHTISLDTVESLLKDLEVK